jgi:F0F1-type ATP synthase gamma subunit
MPPLVRIQEELRDLSAVQFVAGAFAEVSTKKMQALKVAFERSRAFYEDIRYLYAMVRAGVQPGPNAQSGPAISIALTSNHRFYGTLNRDVITSFVEGLWKSGGEGFVIGRTGKLLLERTPYAGRIATLIFKEDIPTENELKLLLDKLSAYTRAYVHYPQFETVLTQRIAVVDTTGEASVDTGIETDPDRTHILEPEYDKIVAFFESGVRRYLMSRVLFEAEVARTAARMVAMSEAEQRASGAIRERRGAASKLYESIQSMRLLETVILLSKWRKDTQKTK